MQPNEYQRLVGRTECDQHASRERMTGIPGPEVPPLLPIRLNHSLIGIAGELGELAALLQKWLYYGKPLTEEMKGKFAEEFGDLLWYTAEGLNALGFSMEDVMKANIRKLAVRYPEKYSGFNAAEENRDRAKEQQAYTSALVQDGHGFGHVTDDKPDGEE